MNLSDLKICEYLAQERHFGRAAARASLSQPAVSLALKRVERHYGVRLFDRGHGTVALTQAGERMLPLIRSMLDRADLLRQAASADHPVGEEAVRVGYTPWTRPHVRRLVAAVRATRPELEIKLSPATVLAQRRLLTEGGLDIACLPSPHGAFDRDGGPATLNLSALAAVRGTARRSRVTLVPDLEDGCIRARIIELLELTGVPDGVREVASPEELIDRVLAGEGSGLVDPCALSMSMRSAVSVQRIGTRGLVIGHRLYAAPGRRDLTDLVATLNGGDGAAQDSPDADAATVVTSIDTRHGLVRVTA